MIETSQTINVKQIVEIILKWHWIIIIPFCLSMIVGSYLVIKLPRIYEAKTVILVQPQKVSSDIVSNIVATDINTRISTLSQRILSRTNLEKIIKDFNLYQATQSKKTFLEDKVAMLRGRISVKVTSSGKGRNANADSFSIIFRGQKPSTVMKITNALASSFINENLKFRETQVLGTNVFLEDELTTMRKKLIEHEKNLKNYREKFMGGLPEQLDSNLRILESLNNQLTNIMSGIRNTQERMSSLEKFSGDIFSDQKNEVPGTQMPATLDQLRNQLESYRNRYTDKHPDVIRIKKRIADFEEKLKKNNQEVDLSDGNSSDRNNKSDSLYVRQMTSLRTEIKRFGIEKKKILKQIKIYKKRVEDTPKREQELLSLQRDYNNINLTYNSLLGRQLETQIAVNMEKKQKGEQFRVLDPARLPQSPASPDKKILFLLTMAAGLGLGGVIIFLIEFLDPSFRSPEDLENFLDVSVIATVPTILLGKDLRWIKLKKIGSVAGILISIILFTCFVSTLAITG